MRRCVAGGVRDLDQQELGAHPRAPRLWPKRRGPTHRGLAFQTSSAAPPARGCGLRPSQQLGLEDAIVRIAEDRDASYSGHGFPQQLERFPNDLSGHTGRAGQVCTRVPQACRGQSDEFCSCGGCLHRRPGKEVARQLGRHGYAPRPTVYGGSTRWRTAPDKVSNGPVWLSLETDGSRSVRIGAQPFLRFAARSWDVECVDKSDPHAFGGAAAKVGLANAIVIAQPRAVTARDDRSCLQHVTSARGLQRVARVLLDKEDAGSGCVDGLDGAEDILHDQRGETGEFIRPRWFL